MKSRFTTSTFLPSLIVGVLLLLVPQFGLAEAFTIKDYDIRVQLNPNGSARITERIEVFFTEERRGIYRNIPYKYKVQPVSGQQARRSQGGAYYETIIKDVEVKGHPFQLFEEEAYLVIRIGDPNVYLSGKQVYEISYTVWGALNDFGDNVEFSWNVVGTEWETDIDQVSFQIEFPRNRSIDKDDVLVFTGHRGSKKSEAEWTLQRGRLTGKTTRKLRPREGVTTAVRFPPDFFDNVDIPLREFAERFYINDHQTKVKINPDASLQVEETYTVEFIQPTSDFTRSLGINPVVFHGEKQFVFIDKEALFVNVSPDFPVNMQINRRRDLDLISVRSAKRPFTGTVTFRFQYKVWGAVGKYGQDSQIKWELMNIDADEPIRSSDFTIQLPEGTQPDRERLYIRVEGDKSPPQATYRYNEAQNELTGSFQRRLLHGEGYYLTFPLTGKNINFDRVPLQVFAQYYVLENVHTDLFLEKGGVVRVRQELRPEFIYPENDNTFTPYFRSAFSPDDTLIMPDFNWLAADHHPLILDVEVPDKNKYEVEEQHGKYKVYLRNYRENQWDDPFVWEYKMYGVMEKSGGEYHMKYPLVFPYDDPVRQGSFTIHFPRTIESENIDARISSTSKRFQVTPEFTDKTIEGHYAEHLRPGEGLVLSMNVPTEYVGGNRFDLWTRLIFRNNFTIFLALLIGGILTLIWYYFGRDPQDAVMVRYYPPRDITPAEAGLLWDDKLHKKDLVSLIYYWAGKGLLKIREEGDGKKDQDYTLIKQKDLPGDAKPFEKIIFKGLSANGKEQTVSDLRDSFYTTMKSAHKSLEKYGKQQNFYQPGTRGFGCLLKVFGFALLFFGIFMLGIGYFTEDFSIGLPATALAIVTLLIARVMPKKGPFGHQKYMELLGFAEFVRRAEIDRIEVLVDENPRYFDDTIAYAIVFGMGEKWAAQFEDLMTEPPDWYEGQYHGRPFSTIYLVDSMTRSMNKMNTDFNYQAPSQSTSSWGGSGGSSFGGGGFSGGGFGGGGGGSW